MIPVAKGAHHQLGPVERRILTNRITMENLALEKSLVGAAEVFRAAIEAASAAGPPSFYEPVEQGAYRDDNAYETARNPNRPWLLAPSDLQALKASGVTFVVSLLERLIEEQARGAPDKAAAIRLVGAPAQV